MTKKEASFYLANMDRKYMEKGMSEALDMAISALEQEPCGDAEQIDYHDDFATALKKINDYEMTRDERVAISILNAYKEGYESAIEDYKQEPCDDAISREAVDKYIARLLSGYLYDGERERLEIFSAYLWELPSVTPKPIECEDAISREAVIYYIKGHIHEIITESGTDKNAHTNSILRALINGVETMPSVTPKPNMTWVTGADGAKIALKDVPVWKAIKICEILGEPQESEDKQ